MAKARLLSISTKVESDSSDSAILRVCAPAKVKALSCPDLAVWVSTLLVALGRGNLPIWQRLSMMSMCTN
jgi:hypothetical protein